MRKWTLFGNRIWIFTVLSAALTILVGGQLAAAPAQDKAVEGTIMAVAYPPDSSVGIAMKGTFRHPRANGEAKVERKRGFTEIEIELDEMKPPTGFGGDYNAYVLWAASPEGKLENLGEFILQGNRSKLNVTTPLSTFGMFVTAEPHFLVDLPSRFVVLVNSHPKEDLEEGSIRTADASYDRFQGDYEFERETLVEVKERSGTHNAHLLEARTAFDLARRAGAEKYAPENFRQARQALDRVNADPADQQKAHEAVRLAAKAEETARETAFQQALQAERQAYSSRIDHLQTAIEQAESQAEQARLEAEQVELEAEMKERARREAQRRAEAAEAEAAQARERAREMASAKERAEDQARQARQTAEQARQTAAEARRDAQEARQEQQEAMNRLRETMSAVTEVKDSARGLIINLPDILFEFDKAALKSDAKIVLAKLSGVLLVVPEYQLEISGHTDSIGSEEYNLELSRRRAESVRNFLVSQGVPLELTDVVAMGESSPVASNDTEQGRQQNRRVEILVEDTLDDAAVLSERD